MADTLTPERAAERLRGLSADVRGAVLLDAAGALAGVTDDDHDHAHRLADLARRLFEEVDRATRDWETEPPEQVEVQIPGGAVFASRTPRWTLAAVARRGALSSLMLYDLRAVLGELEGGPPIRRSAPALSRAAGLAEGMAATMRRMQREREPRVLVYDPAGYARLVQPEARGHEHIMEVAGEMLAMVAERE